MEFEDHPLGDTGTDTRSADPLVYAIEDIEETYASGVPYERAIQVARTELGPSREQATASIEGRISDGELVKVRADRLKTA